MVGFDASEILSVDPIAAQIVINPTTREAHEALLWNNRQESPLEELHVQVVFSKQELVSRNQQSNEYRVSLQTGALGNAVNPFRSHRRTVMCPVVLDNIVLRTPRSWTVHASPPC
jgi:hypothetical protein